MRTFVNIDAVSIAASVNEDRFGLKGNLAWMLDGVSPATRSRVAPSGESDAGWLVDAWDSYLRGVSNDETPLVDLVACGIDVVATAAKEQWTAEPEVEPSTTLTLVRHADDRVDYFVLGDSPLVFLMQDGESVITDDRPDISNHHLLEKIVEDARLTGSFAASREARLVDLAAHRRAHMNKLDGYWVIARDRSASAHALVGSVPLPRSVLLASDGFSRAVSTLGLSPSYDALLSSHTSLLNVAKEIRRAEKADPLCTRYPRWSVHDDCSALHIAPVN